MEVYNMSQPKLVINDLHVSIEEKEIIKGLNLEIKGGEIHAIMCQTERVNQHYLLQSWVTQSMK